MTSPHSPSISAYRPDIDGLRAIAILLVLVFHFDLAKGSKAGFIGVDVFFVISGFLITSILVRQLDGNRLELGAFYLARIRRLAPALTAVLLLTLAVGSVLLFPDDLRELSRQVVASQLYLANFYFWRNVSYFGLGSDNVYLLHMWSLAVEEQFYLVYPLAIGLVHRYRSKWLLFAIATAMILSFAMNILLVSLKPEAVFYLLPTRAWELLVGALVAIWPRQSRTRRADELLGALGAGLLLVAVASYRPDFRFPGWFALWPVVGTALLLLSGSNRPTATSRALSIPLITYVGRISYPLYLIHWPVNVFAKQWLNEQYDLAWRLAMFVLAALIAALIYHFVEHPVRARKVMPSSRLLLQGYGAAVAATLVIFAFVAGTNGIPQRFPSEVVRLANFVRDRSPPLSECEYTGKPLRNDSDFCSLGVPTVRPTWLVFGDSHAWAAHAAFDKWLASKGVRGLFMYRNSCLPLMGVNIFGDKGNCLAFNRSVAAFLERRSDVSVVVLVSTWRQAPEARISRSPDRLLSKADALALFDDAFSNTLANLDRLGKAVYIWEPVPGAKQSVPLALARAELRLQPAHIEFTRSEYLADNDFFFSAIGKNRSRIAVLLSPAQALCESGMCAATIDGNPAYFDNAHVTQSSADFWLRMMQRSEASASGVPR